MNADLLIRTMRLTQINMNCAGIAIFFTTYLQRADHFLIVKSSLRKSSN